MSSQKLQIVRGILGHPGVTILSSAAISNVEKPVAQRWVNRYFVPVLESFTGRAGDRLQCLHFGALDSLEAEGVREAGHDCRTASWDGWTLDAPSALFDVVFGGGFGRLATDSGTRRRLALELARVTRPSGAVLLTLANSRCFLDLSGNTRILHRMGDRFCLSLEEVRQLFIQPGLFREIQLLSLSGHFGWTQAPGPLRGLRPLLEAYVTWSSDAAHPSRYAGPLNPVMNLWIVR